MQLTIISLNIISLYYKTWGIKINVAKSEAICIRNASGKCARFVVPQSKQLALELEGIDIPFKSSIKYLGVNFDKLMKFNSHCRGLLSKAKRISGMFCCLLNNRHLPQKTKLLLYKVAIRSSLIYAFPIWFSISPTVAKELEVFERNILRKCIGKNYENATKRFSNTFVYESAAVTPFCKYALQLQKKFVEKLPFHENCFMNDIFEAEKNISWSMFPYMSPVGIMMEPFNDNPPDFYGKSIPGSHRG